MGAFEVPTQELRPKNKKITDYFELKNTQTKSPFQIK